MGGGIVQARDAISHHSSISEAQFMAFTQGLDQCASPMILIGADLTVLHANPRARAVLNERILQFQGDRLVAGRRLENNALQTALLEVCDEPSVVRLSDRQGRVTMVISLQRLPASSMPDTTIVRTIDVRTPMVLSATTIAEVFCLSPAEARVAGELLAGFGTSAISVRLGIAAETVRTHLKKSMIKTATQSQAQLVAVLARGSLALV